MSTERLATLSENGVGQYSFIPDGNDFKLLGSTPIRSDGSLLSLKDVIRHKGKELPPVPKDLPEPKLTENGLWTAQNSYLGRNEETGQINETPQEMFLRIAHNVAAADLLYDSSKEFEKTRREFYETIANLEFVPNTPTITNAGKKLQQLSACFVLPILDDLDSIGQTLKDAMMIHKTGGGTGFSFNRLRSRGSRVRSTGRESSGALYFLWAYGDVTDRVQQGGSRRGANMGILNIDHPDILRFIAVKSEEHTLNSFNLSVAVTNEFMQKIEKDNQYTPEGLEPQKEQVDQTISKIQKILATPSNFSDKVKAFEEQVKVLHELVLAKNEGEGYSVVNPDTKKVEFKYNARKVSDLITRFAWEKGDPGILFLDRINEDNPTPALGQIEATNPCGEQPLLPYESCNLGAVNLAQMVKDHQIDWEKLKRVVRTGVHFLDNVIDMNRYPLSEIEEMTLGNRKIGLGLMGFADMLVQLGIPYDSEEGLATAERVMDFIRQEARRMSQELANKRGVFPNFKGSIYDEESPFFKGTALKLRNAAVTTIAPNGTTSMLADVNGGIEPFFAISYGKYIVTGETVNTLNPYFVQIAQERGFWSEDLLTKIAANKGSVRGLKEVPEDVQRLFPTASDITPEWHIRMQAAFQKHVDNAISKTINLPNSATQEDIKKAYLLAFQERCKGITIYRDSSREKQILNTEEELFIRPIPEVMKTGETRRIDTKLGTLEITPKEDEDGIPVKFSIDSIGKPGDDALAMTYAITEIVSVGLRSVSPDQALARLELMAEQLSGIGGSSPADSHHGNLPSIPDAMGNFLTGYVKRKKEEDSSIYNEPRIQPRPIPEEFRPGFTKSIETPAGKLHVTINKDKEGGYVFETFTQIGKGTPDVTQLTEGLARIVSFLQRTTPLYQSLAMLEVTGDVLLGIGGRSSVGFGPNKVSSVPDGFAKVIRMYIERERGMGNNGENSKSKNLCPSCHHFTLIHVEGCDKCTNCGHSQC